MTLSPFVDTAFDDEDAFDTFALANGMALQKIYDVMVRNGKPFTYYDLMDAKQDPNWLLLLDQEVRSIYDKLGLTGLPDLASVDLRKQDEFEDFMLTYTQSIQIINANLGIH